jgi:Condensation domain
MQPSIASSSSAAAAEMMMATNSGAFADGRPLKMGAAEKRESVLVRPLGCCERFFHLYALAFPVHFCLVAQIEGALDSAKLGAALEQVRRRHPALGVCIVDDAETGPAFYRIDNPIELNAAPAETAADWRGLVERELNLPFSTFPGPLMRATALLASDSASIVLTFHHAIMDALSGTRILHDVMRALAGESLEVLPPLPPVEEMIADFASGSVFAVEGDSRADISKARAWIAQGSEKFAANLAIAEWDQEETGRLMRSCKANGTTVHGAICAAASRHLPASDASTIRMHCPIDLGRTMRIETTGCGVFIGAGIVEIPTMGHKPLWDDARHIVDSLRTARSPAAAAGMLQWIAAEMPPTAGIDNVVALFASLPKSAAVISNLGVLPLAIEYGSLRLKAVWGPAMLTNLPADRQTIGVSTFAGQLRMVHQSYEPISGLLEAIRGTLFTSCA